MAHVFCRFTRSTRGSNFKSLKRLFCKIHIDFVVCDAVELFNLQLMFGNFIFFIFHKLNCEAGLLRQR